VPNRAPATIEFPTSNLALRSASNSVASLMTPAGISGANKLGQYGDMTAFD